jgi:hypothetical protein
MGLPTLARLSPLLHAQCVTTAAMSPDEFLQYLARYDCLREMEPTFTGLLLRTRLRQESAALATVTVMRSGGPDGGSLAAELEAAG